MNPRTWLISRHFSFYLMGFTLVLLLPCLASLVAVIDLYVSSEQSNLKDSASHYTFDLSSNIERDVGAVVRALKGLAASPSLDNDLSRFQVTAAQALAGRDGELILLDRDGHNRLDGGKPPHLPGSYLEELQAGTAGPTQARISDLLADVPGYGQRIAIAVPVVTRENQDFTLIFAMPTSYFAKRLEEAGPGPPFYASVTDRKGVVIARTRNSERFAGHVAIGFDGMTRDSGYVETFAWRYYQRSPDYGWIFYTMVPHSVMQASLDRSVWFFAFIGLAVTLIAFLCALALTRRMKSAVGITMDAARQLGRGELVDLRYTGIAETDTVYRILVGSSSQLRHQADELKQANAELENRVADRTSELADSNMLTQSILDNSPDIIQVLDDQGRIVFTNENPGHNGANSVTATSHGEAWAASWSADDQAAAKTAIADAQGGKSTRLIVRRASEQGQTQWMEVHVTPMIAPEGPTRRILALSRDVTVQQQRDEELLNARKQAEAASNAKADFLTNMSHEFRTPLNGIVGYCELLASDPAMTASQRTRLGSIQNAAASLLTMVNDLLDLAKIEAGDVTLRPRTFSIVELLDRAAGTVMPTAMAKNLKLETRIGSGMPQAVWGDPDRLTQIVLNLLGNAITFTDRGEVVLSVEGRPGEAGKCHLTIAVKDSGIGISKEAQQYLFQRFTQIPATGHFSQIPSTRERPVGGTGLGLAISRHLIERMGGRIDVESELGHGSTFTVSVDLPIAAADRAKKAAAPASPDAHRACVLVVEDNALNRDLTVELLKQIGCEADAVASAEAALDAVQAKVYDLVLMDEQMPGMSGTEATMRIRALNHPARDVPIVACTAAAFSHHIISFEQAGMNGYITKPFTLAVLADVLARHTQFSPPDAAKTAVENWPAQEAHRPRNFGLLSADRYNTALVELRNELTRLSEVANYTGDIKEIVSRAHSLISSACILDFPDLSKTCYDCERSFACGQGFEAALDELRSAVNRTLKQIEGI